MATDSIQRYHLWESNRSAEGKHRTTWWKGNFRGYTFQWEGWDENEHPSKKKNYRNNKTDSGVDPSRSSIFLKLSADKLLVFKWSQAQVYFLKIYSRKASL